MKPPAEWYEPPRVKITRSYVAIDRAVQAEPWFDNVRVVSAWLRELAALGLAKRRRQPRDFIGPAIRAAICEAFDNRCVYCGRNDVPLEIDHRIPVSKGGSSQLENLVPACKPCNVRKLNHDPADWPLVVSRS